jgi:hypothetical protein
MCGTLFGLTSSFLFWRLIFFVGAQNSSYGSKDLKDEQQPEEIAKSI